MILVDSMQICLANISIAMKVYGDEVNEGYIRHMILNSLKNYNKQHKEEYEEDMEVFEDGDMPVYDEIDIESDDSSYESD